MKITIKGSGDTLKGFKFFWMKSVEGFDDSKHCARCLIGSYSKAVNNHLETNVAHEDLYPEGVILYLCGVAAPFRWEKNFHLAMRVKDGATIETDLYTGQKVVIEGAEMIEFDSSVSDKFYGDKSKAYTTCRNFQFGAYLSSLD